MNQSSPIIPKWRRNRSGRNDVTCICSMFCSIFQLFFSFEFFFNCSICYLAPVIDTASIEFRTFTQIENIINWSSEKIHSCTHPHIITIIFYYSGSTQAFPMHHPMFLRIISKVFWWSCYVDAEKVDSMNSKNGTIYFFGVDIYHPSIYQILLISFMIFKERKQTKNKHKTKQKTIYTQFRKTSSDLWPDFQFAYHFLVFSFLFHRDRDYYTCIEFLLGNENRFIEIPGWKGAHLNCFGNISDGLMQIPLLSNK